MTNPEKFGLMVFAIALFAAVMGVVLLVVGRARGRSDLVASLAFVLPAFLMLAVGLLYPALRTIYQSFFDRRTVNFVGLDNYETIVTNSALVTVLQNTFLWVVITPIVATFIGLIYAVLVDRARIEALAKALIFLPMAISLVGASIIWKFVYDYRSTENVQIGLANQILKSLGLDTYRFLLTEPWNTFFLIVIMIWVQAG